MLVTDGLANLTSSLGTEKDKARATTWFVNQRTPEWYEQLYRASAFARKIVDVPTKDMLRRWRGWSADDELVTLIEAAEKKYRVRQAVSTAHRYGRLYGASAIIVGMDARLGGSDAFLDASRVGQGDLKYLHVDIYPRLQISEWEDDLNSPRFGQPRMYLYQPVVRGAYTTQARVHASRVIPFSGMPLPAMAGVTTQAWGDSVFTSLEDTLSTAGTTTAVIASLLHETKQDIIKTDLSTIETPEGESRVRKRFAIAAQMKSIYNMLLLGDGEDFSQKTFNFQGLPDIHIRMLQELSGMADIPATRFLGQSPAGLQSTGENDLRNYYDSLSGNQEEELTDPVNRLDAVMLRSENIALPKGVFWYWHSLWQESETQKAENGLKRAQAFKVYADSGLIPDDVLSKAIVSRLVEDGAYPALDAAMKEWNKETGGLAEIGEADPDEGDEAAEPEVPSNILPFRRTGTQDAAPRSLYVSRKLTNGDDLVAWARSQGFKNTMPASEMHVTIAYSKAPVDWMKIAPTWQGEKLKVDAGGPRIMEQFGDAVVLLFASSDLQWRHHGIGEAGASWDHPEYQPHVTITWELGDADLSKIVPYNGPLVFGPEIFAEVDENWREKVEAAE